LDIKTIEALMHEHTTSKHYKANKRITNEIFLEKIVFIMPYLGYDRYAWTYLIRRYSYGDWFRCIILSFQGRNVVMKIDWYLCILLCSNYLYSQQFSNHIGAPKNRDLSSGCWGNVKFDIFTLVYQDKAPV